MSSGAPPSSPDVFRCSSLLARFPRVVVAPSHPVAMPSPPPPAPPVAAEHEKRPLPLLKKMNVRFAYAVTCVFGDCMNLLHIGVSIIYVLTSSTDPEVWLPIFPVLLYLLLAVIVLLACQWICYHMPVYGMYAMTDKPPKQQPAAAEVLLLPPPPPEMDMC